MSDQRKYCRVNPNKPGGWVVHHWKNLINTQVEILAVTSQCSTQTLFYSLQSAKVQFLCYISIDFVYFKAEYCLRLPSKWHIPIASPFERMAKSKRRWRDVYVRQWGEGWRAVGGERQTGWCLAQWTRSHWNSQIKLFYFLNWGVPV